MIQFFKLGSLDRFFLLLIFFGLIHGPFLWISDHIQVPELYWIRLGERLSQGWRLYAQALDETGPLPALIYAGLYRLGLADFHVFRIIGAAMVLLQALWLNQMVHRLQLISERNFLVAFFYLLLIHTGPDSVSLSPVLIANWFLLFATARFFKILKDGASSDDAMVLGLWMGLAFLSYQPSLLFLLPIYISSLLFTGLRPNQYLLMLVAALLPTAGVYAFFLVGGGEREFWTCFLAPINPVSKLNLVDWDLFLGFSVLLILIALTGWVVANQNSRVNFQRLGFTVFFFSLIAAAITLFFGTRLSTDRLIFLVPATSFFAAQFMVYTRGVLFQEILGLFCGILFLGGFYGMSDYSFGKQILGHRLFAEDPPKGFMANFLHRPILVLDEDARFIKYNSLATRFNRYYLSGLNRNLSQTHEGLIFWYQCLAEDAPALIYDPHQFIPQLVVRIPEFGRCYKSSFYPNLYEIRPGKKFGTGEVKKD
jgi:hypothetical protein